MAKRKPKNVESLVSTTQAMLHYCQNYASTGRGIFVVCYDEDNRAYQFHNFDNSKKSFKTELASILAMASLDLAGEYDE
jgi:hypothetical protein